MSPLLVAIVKKANIVVTVHIIVKTFSEKKKDEVGSSQYLMSAD